MSSTGDRWRQTSMSFAGWQPDYDLWGGDPRQIMADYIGKKAPLIGHVAGLATVYDFGAEWDPERVNAGDDDGRVSGGAWHVTTLPNVPDRYTFSDNELVARYRETKGQMVCVCGYCEAKLKSRNLQKLRTWFLSHDCITPYSQPP